MQACAVSCYSGSCCMRMQPCQLHRLTIPNWAGVGSKIVRFLGACTSPACMVLEYYSLGSLDDLLHRQRMQLSVGQCLSIALDVALGMRFVTTHSLLDGLKLQMHTMHRAFE